MKPGDTVTLNNYNFNGVCWNNVGCITKFPIGTKFTIDRIGEYDWCRGNGKEKSLVINTVYGGYLPKSLFEGEQENNYEIY